MVIDQRQTLNLATGLWSRHQAWGGRLISVYGLAGGGAELMVASHICGAACLAIEEDPKSVRDALRAGACDFLVNHLDEALRALKNEVRQKRPITVVLQAPLERTLVEMEDRGVSAELTATGGEYKALYREGSALAEAQGWCMLRWSGSTSQDLRLADSTAADMLGDDRPRAPRAAWLRSAPKFFRRQAVPERYAWWSAEERARLRELLPAGVTIDA